jgi:hypothetical protein
MKKMGQTWRLYGTNEKYLVFFLQAYIRTLGTSHRDGRNILEMYVRRCESVNH